MPWPSLSQLQSVLRPELVCVNKTTSNSTIICPSPHMLLSVSRAGLCFRQDLLHSMLVTTVADANSFSRNLHASLLFNLQSSP